MKKEISKKKTFHQFAAIYNILLYVDAKYLFKSFLSNDVVHLIYI